MPPPPPFSFWMLLCFYFALAAKGQIVEIPSNRPSKRSVFFSSNGKMIYCYNLLPMFVWGPEYNWPWECLPLCKALTLADFSFSFYCGYLHISGMVAHWRVKFFQISFHFSSIITCIAMKIHWVSSNYSPISHWVNLKDGYFVTFS